MAKGNTMEDNIASKIKKYQNKTLLDSDGNRCRIVGHTYYSGNKTINIIISRGFGASETKEDVTFPEYDLDMKLDLFTDAPKIDNSDIITAPNIEVKYKTSDTKMSEQTEDNLTGLRKHLFNAIRKLEGGTMKNEDAKAMAQVAQVIINSAKLEMEFKQLTSDKTIINVIS
jgi:hypothetical protein